MASSSFLKSKIEQFRPVRDEENVDVQKCSNDNLCIRFCRKKYRCAMAALAIVTLMLQISYMIVQKTDEATLEKILTEVHRNDSNNEQLLKKLKSFIRKIKGISTTAKPHGPKIIIVSNSQEQKLEEMLKQSTTSNLAGVEYDG